MQAASFFLILFLTVFATGASAQAPAPGGQVSLSEAQAKGLAQQALAQGNFAVADAISSAILASNPDDPEMLMVRAILARRAGARDIARESAASAYTASDNPRLRFDAAMLVADLHAQDEHFTRSQFWLRRADQSAETDRQRAIAAGAYRRVARANPLGIQLRFGVRPSSNVNNGAETTVIEIGGLPFRLDDSGQQLGGYEATAGLSLSWRLSESETQKTEALGELYYRKVWLDSDAKAAAPDVEASDFDYAVVIAGLRHRRLIWPERGTTSFTGLVGQSWYGHDDLARWLEVSASQDVKVSDTSLLTFGATARTEKRLDDGINDSDALGLSLGYRKSLGEDGSYGVSLAVKNVWSDSATVDQFATTISADRRFGRVGPVEPALRVSAENRNYHEFASTVDGRLDQSLSIDLSATWPEVSYYGFVPQANVKARKTWSNVDIYDRSEFSVGLTAVSRF